MIEGAVTVRIGEAKSLQHEDSVDASLEQPSLDIITLEMDKLPSTGFSRTKYSDRGLVCTRPDKPDLHDSFELHFLAEGAANAVFGIRPWSDGCTGTVVRFVDLDGKKINLPPSVLRICKADTKSPSGVQIKTEFEATIRPKFCVKHRSTSNPTTTGRDANEARADGQDFSHHLMDMDLVYINEQVLVDLNQKLVLQNKRRFDGQLDTASKFSLLLPDMSTVPGRAITIEIKPKWLEQSPNAIPGALRCRTCAMRALRGDKHKKAGEYICPLVLAAGSDKVVRPWIQYCIKRTLKAEQLTDLPDQIRESVIDKITEYLAKGGEGHKLLQHMRDLQVEHDPCGALNFEKHRGQWQFLNPVAHGRFWWDKDMTARAGRPLPTDDPGLSGLRLAMTLRDCSMFIRVSYNDQGAAEVESKLGDLDYKAFAKIPDWRDKERQLVREGWYKALGGLQEWEPCLLSKVPRHW